MPKYPDLLVCESTFYAIWVISEIVAVVVIVFFFFFVMVVNVFGWGGRVVACCCWVAEEMLGVEGLEVFLNAKLLFKCLFKRGRSAETY